MVIHINCSKKPSRATTAHMPKLELPPHIHPVYIHVCLDSYNVSSEDFDGMYWKVLSVFYHILAYEFLCNDQKSVSWGLLAFNHKNLISSYLSPSGRLRRM